MKPDKKQVPQMILLGLLVVVFVGYLSFQVAGPGNQVKPKPVASAAKDSPQGDGKEPGQAASSEDMAYVAQVFPTLESAPARRDPFTPQKLPVDVVIADPSQQAAKQISPATSVRTAVNPFRNPMGRVPPLTLGPIPQFSPGNASQNLPPVREAKTEESFALSGVVRGESNVVIIKSASGRHVVREGQMIDGRYKVLSVTGDGAVLAYGKRHIPVKLGGDKNAQ